MIDKQLRVTCDGCGISVIVNQSDELEAERLLERRGWKFPILSFYGGTGHYCKNDSCQKKAEEVRCKNGGGD